VQEDEEEDEEMADYVLKTQVRRVFSSYTALEEQFARLVPHTGPAMATHQSVISHGLC
jgi:hypothetical protein